MTPPLVSVLTPSFNQGRWLADNLRSVAAQSYPAIEHVVMDGGSTDGSVELLKAAGSSVQWQSAPDEGQSDAINRAFRVSSGEIIAWLNSDDAFFSRETVRLAVRAFQDDPGLGMIYGHAALVSDVGEILYVLWAPPFSRRLLRVQNFICQPTVFVRRSAIRRATFVDPECDYMMDRELWLHLADAARIQRVGRILSVDRHHRMRKSYTRLDLAAHDLALIKERYGLPNAAFFGPLQRGLKVATRVAGLSRVPEAARGSDILPLAVGTTRTLVTRQVAQLRRWMPIG